jgi:hypothetical protein
MAGGECPSPITLVPVKNPHLKVNPQACGCNPGLQLPYRTMTRTFNSRALHALTTATSKTRTPWAALASRAMASNTATSLSSDLTLRGTALPGQPTTTPRLVYGTAWKKDRTADLVYQALKSGFRGVDTAAQPRHYQERLVGDGIRRAV